MKSMVPKQSEPHVHQLKQLLWRKADGPEWLVRAAALILPTAFLAFVIFQPWADPKWMFIDPLTAAELSGDCCHVYFGFVSTSGVLLWCATAAICLFSALLIFAKKLGSALLKFSIMAGLLTTLLTLDDAFLLHETVLPSFGISQLGIYALYIIVTLAYLASSWRIVLSNDYWLLVFGGGALFASIVIDSTFLNDLGPLFSLIEESGKFFGIFCWASFHIATLARILIFAGSDDLR